ncbi:MAG: hypothetical protein II295_00970 [Akkermansia sp.]|nr:hypothetical protein [Akkermansia sp.]
MKCRKGWLTVVAVICGVLMGAGVFVVLWPKQMVVSMQPIVEQPAVSEPVSLQEVLLTEACGQAEAALALLRGVNDTFTAEASAMRYAQCWAEVKALGTLWGDCGAGGDTKDAAKSAALKDKLEQLGADLHAEKSRLLAPEVDAYGSAALRDALRGGLPLAGVDADGVEQLVADTAALLRDMAAAAQRDGSAAVPAYYASCVRLRVRWELLAAQGGVMLNLAEQLCRQDDGVVKKALGLWRESCDVQDARVAAVLRLLPREVILF